jgi:hypothetical protein
VFPTLTFPSDHGVTSTILIENKREESLRHRSRRALSRRVNNPTNRTGLETSVNPGRRKEKKI